MMHRLPIVNGLWGGVIALIALCAVTLLPASANVEPNANSCALTTPCLEWDNTSSGAGLKGTSTKGNGVIGVVKRSTGHAGVFGQDLSTGPGNYGIHGDSVYGYALYGSSSNGIGVYSVTTEGVGVYAASHSGYGIWGISNNSTGIYGLSDGASGTGVAAVGATALYAQGSANDAVLAVGPSTYLFRGRNNGVDVFSVDKGGNMQAATAGVSGTISASGNVSGNTGLFYAGLYAANAGMAVTAQAATQGSYLFYGEDDFGSGQFSVDSFGAVYAHSFHTFDAPVTQQKTSAGKRVTTYADQSSAPTLEDFGDAQLVGGYASVAIDNAFASSIDPTAGYMVFITPEGDSRGLYVTQKTLSGFVVRENQGGRSTLAFSYRIVARPFGATGTRLSPAQLPKYPHGRPFSRPTLGHVTGRP